MSTRGGYRLAPPVGRRLFLAALFGCCASWVSGGAAETPRRFRIAFANLNEEPGTHLEGLGFSGAEVRRSFELAARTLPVDMIYYDNAGDGEKALSNAQDAIARKVDLFIAYCSDLEANGEIASRMQAAAIPVLAINYPVPGAPLYTADNLAAGRIAGVTLGQFAKETWSDQNVGAVIAGDLGDTAQYLVDRVRGIIEGLHQDWPNLSPTRLDTSGNPVRIEGLLGKYLRNQPRQKLLIASLDDATALAAKNAIEIAGRISDCVIVSQGLDKSMHGGASDKKEIDPNNRGSLVLGSVAYYMDRYGYEVLPIALKMLSGAPVAPRTTTQHVLISARNVFSEYPPFDMN